MKKPRRRKGGQWVFVPDEDIPEEERHLQRMDEVVQMLSLGWTADNPFAAVDQFHDYFPGENVVPEGGAWILVKDSPPTEFTLRPFSIWFAEPWPMENDRWGCNRVKVMTPRGELGLFPREFSVVKDPAKYYEFLGQGITIHFFGKEEGVPKDALFYLRSRGISKRDALCMLISEIKAPCVLWLETDPKIAATFGREQPEESRIATNPKPPPPDETEPEPEVHTPPRKKRS